MRKHEINKRKKASQKRKSFGKKEEKKVRRKIRGRFQLIFDEEDDKRDTVVSSVFPQSIASKQVRLIP